ncbi:MAG: hypothetical protein HZB18_16970 [Chloroflexi bacterium]|nr:hypothetical protein [Chloroflexota bacterium]
MQRADVAGSAREIYLAFVFEVTTLTMSQLGLAFCSPHLHCNTPALAGGARERSAAQVLCPFVDFVVKGFEM